MLSAFRDSAEQMKKQQESLLNAKETVMRHFSECRVAFASANDQ